MRLKDLRGGKIIVNFVNKKIMLRIMMRMLMAVCVFGFATSEASAFVPPKYILSNMIVYLVS